MDIWHNLNTSTVFKFWPGGIAEGIFNNSALFDNSPMVALLEDKVGGLPLQRDYIAGTADMVTGTFHAYLYPGDGRKYDEEIRDSVLASSAMPGVFPFITRGDKVLLDGGIVWKSDMASGVNRCRDKGYADEDIIVDWILTAETFKKEVSEVNEYHTLKHGIRALGIKHFYDSMKDVEKEKIYFPDVKLRYVIGPSETLTINPVPLDLSRKHLERCIKIGEKDAKNAIKIGPKNYKDLLIKQYHQKLNGKDDINFDQEITAILQKMKLETE